MAEKILVVDDEPALGYIMARHLKKKGYQVVKAYDGVQALNILQSQGGFSVLVTDWSMPGMSGNVLIKEAKKLDPNLVAIIVSAFGQMAKIGTMKYYGAFESLTKPFKSLQELSSAVERAIAYRERQFNAPQEGTPINADLGKDLIC